MPPVGGARPRPCPATTPLDAPKTHIRGLARKVDRAAQAPGFDQQNVIAGGSVGLRNRDVAKGAAIRAIECPCGHHLEGVGDEDLFGQAREHADRAHPEVGRSDGQLGERIAADVVPVT
jgi:hypothetical protein